MKAQRCYLPNMGFMIGRTWSSLYFLTISTKWTSSRCFVSIKKSSANHRFCTACRLLQTSGIRCYRGWCWSTYRLASKRNLQIEAIPGDRNLRSFQWATTCSSKELFTWTNEDADKHRFTISVGILFQNMFHVVMCLFMTSLLALPVKEGTGAMLVQSGVQQLILWPS